MARIRIRVPGKIEDANVSTDPSESLLTSLLKAGQRIRHDCGGKVLCGTCRVRVTEGGRSLSPVQDRERARLEAAGAGPGERLACQAHAARDVVIEAVLPLVEPDEGQPEPGRG